MEMKLLAHTGKNQFFPPKSHFLDLLQKNLFRARRNAQNVKVANSGLKTLTIETFRYEFPAEEINLKILLPV